MNAIKNITVGHTERLRKPVGFTMLANLVNIVPFCLSIEAVNVISGPATAAARRSTPHGCGRSSGYWPSTWRPWHWPNARLTAPISGVPTK